MTNEIDRFACPVCGSTTAYTTHRERWAECVDCRLLYLPKFQRLDGMDDLLN